jgi:sugar phosphate isomerase/epimerase
MLPEAWWDTQLNLLEDELHELYTREHRRNSDMFSPQLGVSLHTLTADLSDESLQAIDESQVATLEIHPELFDGREGEVGKSRLKAMLARSNVRVMTVHSRFGGRYDFSVMDEAAHHDAIETMSASIDLAVEFDAPMVVMHASAEPITPQTRARRFSQSQRALAEIGERCREAGRRAAVELLPRTCLGNTVEELFALLDPLDPDVFGVCLDTNHLMDRYGQLAEAVRRLGKRLFTLHISDYDGVDEQHALPGQGVLDWAAFMQALDAVDYQGPFNYECRLPVPSIQERIRLLEENYAWLCER